MAEQNKSVWLGRARPIIRNAMLLFVTLSALMYLWLVLGNIFFGSEIGMKQFLAPKEHPTVVVMFTLLGSAIVFAGIYFSDFRGAIEIKPEGFFDIVSLVLSRITMIAVVFILVAMLYEVVARYVFNAPTLWANELALWIAGFVFLFAGLYAMQQRSHIRIYIIYDMMPLWMRKASDVLSVILIWFFTFGLIFGSYTDVKTKMARMETFGTAWDPPIPSTVYLGILVIISLVALQALSNLIADWHKIPESHSPMDDIDETEIEHIRKSIED